MTSFCLVHGAWHDDACWQPLVIELEQRGHRCLTPVLPLEDVDASFEGYAAAVIDSMDAAREPPVLVGHSMSSAVIPIVAMRRAVRLLVYLCPAMGGFTPPADEPARFRRGYQRPPVDERNRSWWPRDRAVRQLYGRLDRQLAESLANHLRPQPQAVFAAPYPLAGPPVLPSAFVYAREDELFDDSWSRWISKRTLGIDAIELPGGHFPMLEHPVLLAETLERLARDSA